MRGFMLLSAAAVGKPVVEGAKMVANSSVKSVMKSEMAGEFDLEYKAGPSLPGAGYGVFAERMAHLNHGIWVKGWGKPFARAQVAAGFADPVVRVALILLLENKNERDNAYLVTKAAHQAFQARMAEPYSYARKAAAMREKLNAYRKAATGGSASAAVSDEWADLSPRKKAFVNAFNNKQKDAREDD
jgi:hypothetical protein